MFYNYLLKCFMSIDLKTGHLTYQDRGMVCVARLPCKCFGQEVGVIRKASPFPPEQIAELQF